MISVIGAHLTNFNVTCIRPLSFWYIFHKRARLTEASSASERTRPLPGVRDQVHGPLFSLSWSIQQNLPIFSKMSNIEAILEATDLLTSLSIINAQELLPYQRRLEGALQILQRSVEAGRALQSQFPEPSCTPSTSFSSPSLSESISGDENQNVSRKRAHLSTHDTETDGHLERKKRHQSGVLGLSIIMNDEKISK